MCQNWAGSGNFTGKLLTFGYLIPVRTEELVISRLDELEQLRLLPVIAAKRRETAEQDVGDDT